MSRWKEGDGLAPVHLPLTLRRAVQAVAGTRDYYPVHHDEAAARANGAHTIFFNTMFLQAFAGRAAAEWFGNDAFLRRLEVAMQSPAYVGRTLTAEGRVAAVRGGSDGRSLLDVEATLSTEDGTAAAVKLTVEVPARVSGRAAR